MRPQEVPGLLLRSYSGAVSSDGGRMCAAAPATYRGRTEHGNAGTQGAAGPVPWRPGSGRTRRRPRP
ncbi:hypothetical protein, partial [Streptomyces diastatochromogenes]|uniref:hypothetical protein n=1 Tax=Streptomyces diastatochromogenes TaxID=42236 RepID=UPI001ABFC565